jgi:hypothetical protein
MFIDDGHYLVVSEIEDNSESERYSLVKDLNRVSYAKKKDLSRSYQPSINLIMEQIDENNEQKNSNLIR